MMKVRDTSTRTRRRRHRANGSIVTFFYVAVLYGRDVGTFCRFPAVESRRYDERHFQPRGIVDGIRCGGGDDDGMEIRTTSQILPSSRADTSVASVESDGRRTSRLQRKIIILLRGGVDNEKREDDESEDTTTSESNERDVDASARTELHDKSDRAHQLNDANDGGISYQINRAFYSFLSRFRAPVELDDHDSRAADISGIAHKMPHGPDGRGGGGAAVEALPVRGVNETKELVGVKQFVLTAEITEVTIEDVDVDKLESKKLSSPEKSPVGTITSTAFVVPPHHSHTGKGDDMKEIKSSKIKLAVGEVYHTNAMTISPNSTQNETDTITLSNATLNGNTTESISVSGAANVVGENANDLKLLNQKDYTSSGYWTGIDLVASIGLSTFNDDLKISRALRPFRKAAARATGLHGFVSGKQYPQNHLLLDPENSISGKTSRVISIDEELGIHNVNALEAETLARRFASRKMRRRAQDSRTRRWGFRRGQQVPRARGNVVSDYVVVPDLDMSPDALEHRRLKRVEEIDRLLQRGRERLLELQCERDDLLCAPNPLFNYTKKYDPSTNQTFGDVRTTRELNFPPPELVDEYIGELVSFGRLIRLNHTELWQSRSDYGVDDDEVGDDLLTPGAGARKLYENLDQLERGIDSWNRNKRGGGSWLLRQGLGGGSLGEKLGEAIEIAAYKGVCAAVMKVFAQMLSGLHGVNVLSHADIRTYIEQDPDLPPVDRKYGPLSRDGNNYAHEAIKSAIQKGARKKRKTGKSHSSHRSSTRRHGHELSDDAFIQRDAVVETLISHCQISAPLLKLFPLDWQRAMVGNVITLATAIVSDFADGLQVQLLGHFLTVSFKPITEADMIQHIGVGGFRQNHRRTRPAEFEAAVLATALDISESLSFLDGWLEWIERKVGGGVVRSQIGNLIARVVLTLVDEVLSGARLDLWSSQANGPRLYAALEYRVSTKVEEHLND